MICRGIACCSVIDVINLPELHLFVDVLPIILEFLPIKEIMRSRRVCKKWKEAVRRAIAHDNFYVDSVEAYTLLRAMVRALPNLQKLRLGYLGIGQKFTDGEDPDEEEAQLLFIGMTPHDIEIISNFSKLRVLDIINYVPLNGRYPVLFNSFPMLQKLSICNCSFLKWDLDMLSGLPLLKELNCYISPGLTGNINSLRVLKNTLEKVNILYGCDNVEGNFMDLADFPHLKELDLDGTAVTGDIRDIKETDFSSLENLNLPKRVYGGKGYQLQSISDGTGIVRTLYHFKKQCPALSLKNWFGELSEASPDWYGPDVVEYRTNTSQLDTPPFLIRIVVVGSRIGYRWETKRGIPCELNWLDPEPDRESSDSCSKYIEELREIESRLDIFRGFYQPPTEEELFRLLFG